MAFEHAKNLSILLERRDEAGDRNSALQQLHALVELLRRGLELLRSDEGVRETERARRW